MNGLCETQLYNQSVLERVIAVIRSVSMAR
jgi:hypothetical protein